MWFHLLDQEHNLANTCKAWYNAKIKYQEQGWPGIRGPIGATVGTLDAIGWVPAMALVWFARDGSKWAYKPHGGVDDVLAEVTKDAISTLWEQAAQHHNGGGLDSGWDYTVYHQLRRQLRKTGKHAVLGRMETGMAAG